MRKNSAIMQMYYGERGQYDHIPYSDEARRLLDEFIKEDAQFRAHLSNFPDLLKLYEKVNDSIEALNCETEDNYYAEGFRFGFLMGLDVAENSPREEK